MSEASKRGLLPHTPLAVENLNHGLRQIVDEEVGLSRKAIAAGYDAVKPDEDGDPNTVWGLVQGLTRYSQTFPNADERTKIDRAAGKIMDIEF